MVKRYLMLQLWRVQQSMTLLSLILWAIVISLTALPIINPVWLRFLEDRFGIPPNAPGVVALTLVLIFLGVFAFLISVGLIYDKYLRLWRGPRGGGAQRQPHHPARSS